MTVSSEESGEWKKVREGMKIYVDADACPVIGIVEKIAQKYQIPVMLLCDTNHISVS